MEERRFNTLMLVTLLHTVGCAQAATSLDRGAPQADARTEPSPAPQDVEEAPEGGGEVGIDVEVDVVDGDAAGDDLDAGDVSEDPAGDDLDVGLLLDAEAGLDLDADADLRPDADLAPDVDIAPDVGLAPDADADLPADVPCEAGADRCGTRLCAPGPCELRTPRPLAPIAALRLHTARPWFRWELPTGADGARLEVCATLRCDRVEHTWEVDGGRFRPPVALSQGVHFWRLTARRRGLFAAVAGPIWAFGVDLTVPVRETPMARRDALLDVNGDGVEEQVADPAMPPPGLSWAFDLILSGTSPPVRQRFAGGSGYYNAMPGTRPNGRTYYLAGIFPVGDVNGDGFGDLATAEQEVFVRGGEDFDVHLYLGGRDGVSEGPQRMDSPTGRPAAVAALAVGDVNGDGYGDAFLNWHGDLGWGQLLVGGADRRVLRDACGLRSGWFGHGDVDADGYEDVMTTSSTRGTWTEAFALLPGGPDVGRAVRCGVVSRSTGILYPLRLPPEVRAHVFDENGDGYDDVVIDDDLAMMGTYQIFRGGSSGIPFTDRGF